MAVLSRRPVNDLPERCSYLMMEKGKPVDLAVIEKYFNEYQSMTQKM